MFDLFKKIMNPDSIGFFKDWSDFRMYAISKHGAQKYGELPYAYHLAMVESVLAEYGYHSYEYQAAAWLHDVVEDTPVKLENICHSFGGAVAALVDAVTGTGANRKERAAAMYKKVKAHPAAAPLKVADRLANVTFANRQMIGTGDSSKIKMYLKEWPEFKANLQELMLVTPQSRLLWSDLEFLIDSCQEQFDKEKGEEAEASPPSL